jgi:hypothetical protein
MTAHRPDTPVPPGAFRSLLVMAGASFVIVILTQVEPAIPLAKVPLMLGGWALIWTLAALWFIPGFLLAEDASARWGHRVWIYAAVVLVGSVAVALAGVALNDGSGMWMPLQRFRFGHRFLRVFVEVFWRIGLAAIVYATHRRALAATLTFQQLETRQTEMMARLAESRLQTARARVRPEAFIEELQGLRRQYIEGAPAAEASLQTMIDRLRAASRGTAP